VASRDNGYCIDLDIVNPFGDLKYGFGWFLSSKSLNVEDESLSLFSRNFNHIVDSHARPYGGYLHQQ